jgi:hypothetical protein
VALSITLLGVLGGCADPEGDTATGSPYVVDRVAAPPEGLSASTDTGAPVAAMEGLDVEGGEPVNPAVDVAEPWETSVAPDGDSEELEPSGSGSTDAELGVETVGELGVETVGDVDTDSSETAQEGSFGPEDPCAAHDLDAATWVEVVEPTSWNTHQDRVPFNQHMTYQGDVGTTMTMQWATTLADLEVYSPRVWIAPLDQVQGEGETQAMRWSEAGVWTGVGEVYRESLLGIVLGETDWVTWTVSLTCLTPNTTYAYRVGSWESVDAETGIVVAPDLSPIGTFTTGKPAGEAGPFEVLLAGDSRGGTDTIRDEMAHLSMLPSDFWCFNGDMSNGGTQPEWSDWMDAMGPILASRPLMGVQGNHEVFANVYYAQFAFPVMPGLEPELVEHAWAFTYGNAHFIGLDSNSEEAVIGQVPWLEGHLATVAADPEIDWIFAMMHHAPYSACSVHGSTARLQTHWVPLFEAYGVDIVFAGHDHNYERTHPVLDQAVATPEEGVVYVVAGAFGAPAYTNGNDWWTAVSVHGAVGNYVRVQIDGKQLELKAYSLDGTQVLDTLTIDKEEPGEAP